MNKLSVDDKFSIKKGNRVKLIRELTNFLQYIEEPMLGPAKLVFLLIQPEEDPIMKSLDVEIVANSECSGENFHDVTRLMSRREEWKCPKEITVQLMIRYEDGRLLRDVLTVK